MVAEILHLLNPILILVQFHMNILIVEHTVVFELMELELQKSLQLRFRHDNALFLLVSVPVRMYINPLFDKSCNWCYLSTLTVAFIFGSLLPKKPEVNRK